MKIIFYLLLMLSVGRCELDQIFDTQTVGVGDDVALKCARESSGSLFWFRLVSGDLPKVLGKTFSFETDPRITATEEPGFFVLLIKEAKLSDAAVYFCMKKYKNNFTFLKGIDLRVKGPDTTAVPPSDPVRPGASLSLQCSVLSDSENKTCPGGHSVCCFRAGSHQCHPSFNYTDGNRVAEHEKNPDGLSQKKCVYSFFKNVSSSDAGTCFCAAATCEDTFSISNDSKLNTEALNMWNSQKNNTVVCLLCAALVISLIVIAFLTYSVKKLKKKSCACCDDAFALQTSAASAGGHQQSQQTDEDSLVYSAPTFTSRKTSKGGTRDAKTDEEESIYSHVRARGLESENQT
ncbi:uncharacterized protein LOC131981455 [Centropristis striata]|uniref:uncharacterized protein LOC131981455 n=1 Tax=Centropristis striata TaxID=184440 RepID=UPI0027E1C597|nr:uncharacterized protein LOC131981455 [Centropristis striata]